jgi:hypothetical protein
VLFLLAGCAQAPAKWDVADIRLLDPADDAPSTNADIVALYTRPVGGDRQVRVDLLDIGDAGPERVLLAFDTAPGGTHELPGLPDEADIEWDWLVSVPSADTTRVDLPDGSLPLPGLAPEASYNTAQDYLTVTLPAGLLPETFSFQAFTVSEEGLADSSEMVSSDAPPPARAPLLLFFRDVFPAVSPATALRRWDGAHTGPYGERHGLHSLLDAARANRVPLALLDLLDSRTLSGLDLVDDLFHARQAGAEGLLILPQDDRPQPPSRLRSVLESNTPALVPPQTLPGDQVDPQGLTAGAVRALVSAALSPDPGEVVALGGSLPSSAWGDADAAHAGMSFIAQHPWIDPLDEQELQAFPDILGSPSPTAASSASHARQTATGESAGMDSAELAGELYERLQSAPANPITDAGLDMFLALTGTTDSSDLAALRAQYLGEVGSFLAASGWAASPVPRASCEVDIDYDRMSECVLANERLFAVFEKDGGRLAWLFGLENGRPHQLIGGTQQFVAGLSDPSRWQLERGPAADPGQIAGAFVDADAPWGTYEVSALGPDSLVLTNSDGSRRKSFRLLPDRVSVEYGLSAPLATRIALTLDPWRRFGSGWGDDFSSRLRSDRVSWRLSGGPSLSIESEGRTGFAAFNDTLEYLSGPEDPDQGFPPGHYLPFPMAVADFVLTNSSVVLIEVR